MNYETDTNMQRIMIYNVARFYGNSIDESLQYANSIPKYAKMYKLPPILLMRQVVKESQFNRFAINENEQARGFPQIISKYWWYVPAKVFGTNYSPRDFNRYFFDIDSSAHMMCYIMRYLLDKSKGDYPLSLIAYNFGPYSWWYTHYYRNNYNKMKSLRYWRYVYDDEYFYWDTGISREYVFHKGLWNYEVLHKIPNEGMIEAPEVVP